VKEQSSFSCSCVYVELYEEMSVEKSVEFLKNLINDCPFKITKILTDNGAQFTAKQGIDFVNYDAL
jgi:hypothetical protein